MLNCAVIMGRLVADPELRTTTTGVSVTSFRVAVDRNFVRQGEERQADFLDIVAWRQTAEFVTRFFRKGSMIAVQGAIQTRSYEDKSGNRRTAVEIIADNVSFCGSKAETGGGNVTNRYDDQVPPTPYNNAQAQIQAQPAPSFASGTPGDFSDIQDDDELPF
ncbi:MAG: single-stranded DNA-binding protein [Oscillospiraceae bacterium]|nr:single-stranded DNA-binding protein [Oscillospiraceae bacterium]